MPNCIMLGLVFKMCLFVDFPDIFYRCVLLCILLGCHISRMGDSVVPHYLQNGSQTIRLGDRRLSLGGGGGHFASPESSFGRLWGVSWPWWVPVEVLGPILQRKGQILGPPCCSFFRQEVRCFLSRVLKASGEEVGEGV